MSAIKVYKYQAGRIHAKCCADGEGSFLQAKYKGTHNTIIVFTDHHQHMGIPTVKNYVKDYGMLPQGYSDTKGRLTHQRVVLG